MSRRNHFCFLFLFVAVAVLLVSSAPLANADDPDPMSDFYEDPFDPFRDYLEIPLSQILKAPNSYTNRHVEFNIIYHKVDENWSPFFSPFDPENYVNFSGWKANARLWIKEEMTNDFPFFYIENENNNIDEILQANKFAMIELQGTVVTVMEGYPFIEIKNADVIYNDLYDQNLLRLLILGHEALEKGELDKGLDKYKRALRIGSDQIPYSAKAAVHREMAIAYYEKKNYGWALDHAIKTLSLKDERDLKMSTIRRKSWKRILAKRRGEPIKEDHEKEDSGMEKKQNEKNENGDNSSFVPPERFRQTGEMEQQGSFVIKRLKAKIERLSEKLKTVKKREQTLTDRNNSLKKALTRTRKNLDQRRKQVRTLRKKLSDQFKENARLYAKIRQQKNKIRSSRTHQVSGTPMNSIQDRSLAAAAVFNEVSMATETRTYKTLERVRNRNSKLRSRINKLSTTTRNREQTIQQLRDDLKKAYRENARLRMELMDKNSSSKNSRDGSKSKTSSISGKHDSKNKEIDLPPYPEGRIVTGGFRSREEVREEMNEFMKALRKHYPRYRDMKDEVLEQKIRNRELEGVDCAR